MLRTTATVLILSAYTMYAWGVALGFWGYAELMLALAIKPVMCISKFKFSCNRIAIVFQKLPPLIASVYKATKMTTTIWSLMVNMYALKVRPLPASAEQGYVEYISESKWASLYNKISHHWFKATHVLK